MKKKTEKTAPEKESGRSKKKEEPLVEAEAEPRVSHKREIWGVILLALILIVFIVVFVIRFRKKRRLKKESQKNAEE